MKKPFLRLTKTRSWLNLPRVKSAYAIRGYLTVKRNAFAKFKIYCQVLFKVVANFQLATAFRDKDTPEPQGYNEAR